MLFEEYPWPGNVRELENLLENLVITTPGPIIHRENLPRKLLTRQSAPSAGEEAAPLKVAVEQAERRLIEQSIEKQGSIRKAAAALRWTRPPSCANCKTTRRQMPRRTPNAGKKQAAMPLALLVTLV